MRHLSFMIIFIFSHLISIAQIANKEAYEGNKLYASGQFKEAESKYQSSLKNQQNKEIQYNLGNALYQQKKIFDFSSRETKIHYPVLLLVFHHNYQLFQNDFCG